MTTNHRGERSRITRKRLAQDIAKWVEAYLEELKVSGPMMKSVSFVDYVPRQLEPPTLSTSKICFSQS